LEGGELECNRLAVRRLLLVTLSKRVAPELLSGEDPIDLVDRCNRVSCFVFSYCLLTPLTNRAEHQLGIRMGAEYEP